MCTSAKIWFLILLTGLALTLVLLFITVIVELVVCVLYWSVRPQYSTQVLADDSSLLNILDASTSLSIILLSELILIVILYSGLVTCRYRHRRAILSQRQRQREAGGTVSGDVIRPARSQSSGLPTYSAVATERERLITGRAPPPNYEESASTN